MINFIVYMHIFLKILVNNNHTNHHSKLIQHVLWHSIKKVISASNSLLKCLNFTFMCLSSLAK